MKSTKNRISFCLGLFVFYISFEHKLRNCVWIPNTKPFQKRVNKLLSKKLFFQKLIRKQKIMKQLLQGLLPQKTAQPCKTLKLQYHRLWCYNSYCDWLPHFEIISSKNIVKHKKLRDAKKKENCQQKFLRFITLSQI